MDEVVVRATLLAASRAKTLQDVAPYDEALCWQEYRVEKVVHGDLRDDPSRIRVAHWSVLRGKTFAVPAAINQQVELRLRPIRHFPGIESVASSDDLEITVEELPYFVDVAPLRAGVGDQWSRWDYGGTFSNQMRLYWELRGQLESVVLGNSHAAKDIAPHLLKWGQNESIPNVLNMGAAGSNMNLQCLLAEKYVATLPKIRTVIWVASLRSFNKERESARKERDFLASSGYAYDCAHPESLGASAAGWREVSVQQLTNFSKGFVDAWGWEARSQGHVPTDATALNAYVEKTIGLPKFAFDEKTWALFEAQVRSLAGKGLKVVLIVPPLHPVFAGRDISDPDGTSTEGAVQTIQRLEKLAADCPGVSFRDFNLGGRNDFVSEEFYDLDHLAAPGAERFTRMLADWMAAH